jgi:hypothetical protein
VTSSLVRVEDVLADHERSITSTRLKLSDAVLTAASSSSSSTTGPGVDHILSPIKGSHRSLQQQNKAGLVGSGLADGRGFALFDENTAPGPSSSVGGRTLADSRSEARDLERVQGEVRASSDRILAVQEALRSVISIDEREALAASIKDISKRLETVISGTSPIKSVEIALADLNSKAQETQAFLQLPQSKSLRAQLGGNVS